MIKKIGSFPYQSKNNKNLKFSKYRYLRSLRSLKKMKCSLKTEIMISAGINKRLTKVSRQIRNSMPLQILLNIQNSNRWSRNQIFPV